VYQHLSDTSPMSSLWKLIALKLECVASTIHKDTRSYLEGLTASLAVRLIGLWLVIGSRKVVHNIK